MKTLRSLSSNIGIDFQPVFRSKPSQQILRPKEKKPDLFNPFPAKGFPTDE